MPLIQISLAEGRTPEQLRQLIAEVTEVAIRVANAPKEAVSVIITEVAPTKWATGDVTVQERRDQAAT
jgi:4-oxalocrotonate tautomerase